MNWRDFLGFLQNSTLIGPLLKSRADVMAKAGTTFGGNRKHYESFGWPLSPDWDWYEHLYKRGGIAKRIVNAYPQATWRSAPTVQEKGKEDPKKESPFEEVWKEFAGKRRIFQYFERADRLARLGTFSVLFLGYSDGLDFNRLSEPVQMVSGTNPWDKLLYLQPYGEDKIKIASWDDNAKSERFGMPSTYQIQLSTPLLGGASLRATNRTVLVHWSRVLHVAEDVVDSDIEGTPCLESVLNYLLDLEKTHGSAAEAFYQQSPPLTLFNADKDANIDQTTFSDDDMGTQMEYFINGYKRWLATQGITATTLSPQLGDPSNVKEMLLELISGTTGIPKRILVGSERGELASTQDETAWNSRVEERQLNWAEPMVLRPFIDEMIAKAVLPMPKSGYDIVWTSNQSMGDEAKARVAQTLSDAVAKYGASPGAQEVMPPDMFLESVLMLDPEVIDRIKETREELWEKTLEDSLSEEEEEVPEEGFPGGGQQSTNPFAHKKASGGKKAGSKHFEEIEHPRGRGGKFKVKGSALSDKARRSLVSHVTATREMQRAAIKNEKDLAKRLGAKHLKDNEPFDVCIGKSHAIEVKTILVGKHDKITMRKECRERKLEYASKTGVKPHTVVFDNRSGKVYYSKGVGSFRLSSMEQIGTIGSYGVKLKERIKE